jgi:hypothetical protein
MTTHNSLKEIILNSGEPLLKCIEIYKLSKIHPSPISFLEKLHFGIELNNDDFNHCSYTYNDRFICGTIDNPNSNFYKNAIINGENLSFKNDIYLVNKFKKINFLLKGKTIINGNLFIKNCNLKYLPDNLTILGNLTILHCTNIYYLPSNLTVKENLSITDTKITALPNCLKSKMISFSSQTKNSVKYIPKHLKNKIYTYDILDRI